MANDVDITKIKHHPFIVTVDEDVVGRSRKRRALSRIRNFTSA